MNTSPVSSARTFDGIKKQYRSLLERLYAAKKVDDEMRQEARELYIEAELLLCNFAHEMRMTSVERREAQARVKLAARGEDREAIDQLNADEHKIWRRHMLLDAQYVALCHIAKGLNDGFLS
jgi:hypothetical protein